MYSFDESFLRPSRMAVELVQPHILNNLTSTLQISLLLEVVKRSYMGQVYLSPVEIAQDLGSHPDTIRHKLHYFCQLGILSHSYKHVYSFPFFKSMIKDDKGYIKLYDFLFKPLFTNLTLKSQRAILYVLSQLAGRSLFDTRNIIIDTNEWYSRNEQYRLFPLTHKHEVNDIVQDLAVFFDMDITFYNSKGSIAIQGLKTDFQKEFLSTSRYEWMLRFLEEYRVYYIHPYHLKHLVTVMDSLSMNMDYSDVLEVWHNALFIMRFDTNAHSFLGSLSVEQTNDEQGYSKVILYFNNHYLQQALLQFGMTIETALKRDQIHTTLNMEDWKTAQDLVRAKEKISTLWRKRANQLAAVIKDFYLPKAMDWISKQTISTDNEISQFVPQIIKKFKVFKLFTDQWSDIDTGISYITQEIKRRIISNNYQPYNWVKANS